MTRIFRVLTLSIALLLCVGACRSSEEDAARSVLAAEVTSLIDSASNDLKNQDFEAAMEKALRALDISRKEGYSLGEVQALYSITGIDIMATRDADAWERPSRRRPLRVEKGSARSCLRSLLPKPNCAHMRRYHRKPDVTMKA